MYLFLTVIDLFLKILLGRIKEEGSRGSEGKYQPNT